MEVLVGGSGRGDGGESCGRCVHRKRYLRVKDAVGYSHSPCSFHYVYVDSYLVLCGRPVRAAIHLVS